MVGFGIQNLGEDWSRGVSMELVHTNNALRKCEGMAYLIKPYLDSRRISVGV